jgi:hypothetical protein
LFGKQRPGKKAATKKEVPGGKGLGREGEKVSNFSSILLTYTY